MKIHLRILMNLVKNVVRLKKLTQIVKQAYLLILPTFNTAMQQAQASFYLFRRKLVVARERRIEKLRSGCRTFMI
jgi:hypothetical protein